MSGPLDAIQTTLAKAITPGSWAADNLARGEMVAKARRYQAGEHDAQMTDEMKKALRVATSGGSTHAPFNSNQMDDVITTLADRLTVDRIEGDNEAATAWAEQVLDWNSFDGLQMDVHEAALRDGDSYMLVEFDNDEQMPYLCHEPAWDGTSGMMVLHAANDKNVIAAAVKVWLETQQEYADTLRFNIYYPNRIEKYIHRSEGAPEHYDDPDYPGVWPIPWTMNGQADGEPIGVPVVQFRNRAQGKGGFGRSELAQGIPLQDALNRTLHSMVMTAELNAFAILIALGFEMPAAVTPGMVINIGKEGLTTNQVADLKRLAGVDLLPYINMAEFFIGRVEAVTRTPNMQANANLSGEAMKQSEIKLLGKVKRFQVRAGSSWKDVMMLAARVQTAYGTEMPPANKRWRTRWGDAQIRNDKDVVTNAMLIKDVVGLDQTLLNLSPVYGWDEKQRAVIKTDVQRGQVDRLAALTQNFNAFNGGGSQRPAAPISTNVQQMQSLMQGVR